MSAIADLKDNFRAPLDPYGAVTHEVFNQPVELADYNLFDSDAALKEAVEREGAAWATDGLDKFRCSRRVGRVPGARRARQPASAGIRHPRPLRAARRSRALPPAYHALMKAASRREFIRRHGPSRARARMSRAPRASICRPRSRPGTVARSP